MNCANSIELFENLPWHTVCLDVQYRVMTMLLFYDIVEVMRCTWTSVHDVSFITGCHYSQGCLTEKMHIFSGCFVECTAPEVQMTSLHWGKKYFGLMFRNTGSLLWQKSTLMSCLVAAIHRYILFSLAFARGDRRVTRLLPVWDAYNEIWFEFFLFCFVCLRRTCKTQGFICPHVHVCVFSNETTEQLLKLDNRLEPKGRFIF